MATTVDKMETDVDQLQFSGTDKEIRIADFKDTRQIRIAAHSHIYGLGLNEQRDAVYKDGGMVGQQAAREACGVIVDMIKAKQMSGKAVLLAGPPGTGKTAIAMAMSQELGEKVPFVPIVASEIFSNEVKKTEMLTEAVRKSISVCIKETVSYFEGEVTEITPIEDESAPKTYGKTIRHVNISLKSVGGWKRVQIDANLYDSMLQQNIEIGDVIVLDTTNGSIKRRGRCDVYQAEHDLESDLYVPLPPGAVHRTTEEVKYVTLHSLDVANANPKTGREGGLSGFLQRAMKSKKTEITERLRLEVNNVVDNQIKAGVAFLLPGVLFIDEVHMLDMECFTFLHRVIESQQSPIIVFATNRGMSPLRNSTVPVPLGIPPDVLDRVLIVPTRPYNKNEIQQIIEIRAAAEGVKLSSEALFKFGEIGLKASLRFAIQLLTPCKLLAEISKSPVVTQEVIDEARSLFMDARTSALLLKDNSNQAADGEAVSA